jgi:hypothetical protein
MNLVRYRFLNSWQNHGLQQNPIPSPLACGYGRERVEPKRREEGQHRRLQIPKLV